MDKVPLAKKKTLIVFGITYRKVDALVLEKRLRKGPLTLTMKLFSRLLATPEVYYLQNWLDMHRPMVITANFGNYR